MLLYINSDQDPATGWEGYDLLVNATVSSATSASIQAWKKKKWGKSVEISCSYESNELMIQVPKTMLETSAFDFHWVDNVPVSGMIEDFFLKGDNAPERRSNYRFQE